MEATMKFRAKFAVTMIALTFVLGSAYVTHAGSAHHQIGQGSDKAVSSDNGNIVEPSGQAAKASTGPYKYNYNERHGVTNDFGQDKAGNLTKF